VVRRVRFLKKTPANATAWEYKLLTIGNPLEPDTELRANVIGKLGWELAAIDAGVWVFKRPLVEDTNSDALAEEIEQTVPLATDHESTLAIGEVLPT
jgi:hypothetical protein